MKKIYFAHPIVLYGTNKEKEIIKLIEKEFPKSLFEILNPGNYKNEFQEWKKNNSKEHFMNYFLELVDMCDILVLHPFEDGDIGAGIGLELEQALFHNLPSYIIDSDTYEFTKITSMRDIKVMSIKETKEKTKYILNNE